MYEKYDKIQATRIKVHPILTDDIISKPIDVKETNFKSVVVVDNDQIISYASYKYYINVETKPIPFIGVRTKGSSRYVSILMMLPDYKLNLTGQKLLARCVLWAAGRI
jgi:hypothetical protein